MAKHKTLNARQKHFAINLASGMSQAEAYTKAGYNSVVPGPQATELLQKNASVRAYYNQLIKRRENLLEKVSVEKIMQPHEVKARLSELARANLVDFIDEDGNPVLNRGIPNHGAAKKYYRKRRKDRFGNDIETSEIALVDQIEALRELAKIHGLYAPSKHLIAQNTKIRVEFVKEEKYTDVESEYT